MVVLNNVSAKIYLCTEHLTLGTPLPPPQLVTPSMPGPIRCPQLCALRLQLFTSLPLSLSLQATGPGDRRPNDKGSS